MIPAAAIAAGLDLEPWPAVPVPPGTRSQLYGHELSSGVPTADIITPSQTEIMKLFDRTDGYVDPAVATCYRRYNPRTTNAIHRSVVAMSGDRYNPGTASMSG